MCRWVIALAVLASIPAWADTRFRVAQMSRLDLPVGKGQCDIRLQVDNEVDVTVRGDLVVSHTVSGQDARDDGSECNLPLPDRDLHGFKFQSLDGRGDVRVVEQPSPRNGFALVVKILDSASGFGRYHLRLTWDSEPSAPPPVRDDVDRTRGPDGFAWNNATSYHGRGGGESLLNDSRQRLADVSVNVDLAGKIVVSFARPRGRGASVTPRPVIFTGTLLSREGARLRADVVTEDRRLHGTMTLSVDDRQNVNSVTLDATDGRDRLHVTWDRR